MRVVRKRARGHRFRGVGNESDMLEGWVFLPTSATEILDHGLSISNDTNESSRELQLKQRAEGQLMRDLGKKGMKFFECRRRNLRF